MALSSQAARSRSGGGSPGASSRRGKIWPWLVVAGVGVAAAGLLLWPGGGPADGPDRAVARDSADAEGQPAPGSPSSDAEAASAASANADQEEGSASSETVPTMTLSRDAAAPSSADSGGPGGMGQSRDGSAGGAAALPSGLRSDEADPARGASPQAPPRSTKAASSRFRRGMNLIADNQLVQARRVLSPLLFSMEDQVSDEMARRTRQALTRVNQSLMFSSRVVPGDPLTERYQVQSGDLLATIAPKYQLTYQLLEQVNGIRGRSLRVGQEIKLIHGPFHARIDKSDYRIDLYLRGPDGSPLYIRGFPVAVGERNSTPPGRWIVKPGHKVTNPGWSNPRTGEHFAPDDPNNPIGEYWIALEGAGSRTSGARGYGIHGTIDPDSIGTQASMGCIRLHKKDIKQVFRMLVGGDSTVRIRE